MGLFDYLRSKTVAGAGSAASRPPVEQIFAVPLAARKLEPAGEKPGRKYVFYSFLFADSAEHAVARLRQELRGEGLEFIELTGEVLATTIPEWTNFVAARFDFFKNSLPSAKRLADDSHGIVYYTPKIVQY